MKKTLITLLLIAATAPAAWAQDRIYRCGNEYTNNAQQAKAGTAPAASPPSAPRVATNDQKARDADARAILESELRKAEARHAELVKEYNGGAPERNALDLRNPQRYMERTAELKASVARSESDIAGIKREIARLPAN